MTTIALKNSQLRSISVEATHDLASWVVDNAHRIYPAMEEKGWCSDSLYRERLFAFAAEERGVDYDDLYDAFLMERPVGE